MNARVEDDYRLLAARHFRRQAKKLASQMKGARRADDIEYVHRARIASRRLRAGLRTFACCLPPEIHKRWKREIRRITRGLGEARDKDVHIASLSKLLAGVSEVSLVPGIARLLAHWEAEREACQPRVLKAVKRFQRRGVLDEMRQMAKETLADAGADCAREPGRFTRAQGREQILAQLEDVCSHEASLSDPRRREEHHAMRIAAKRLRYTMEIFLPVYGKELDEFVSTARCLQELLGTIHDSDIWLDELAAFTKQERRKTVKAFGHIKPFGRLRPGLKHLRTVWAGERAKAFEELRAYWRNLRRENAWRRLRTIVQSRPLAQPAPATQKTLPIEKRDAEARTQREHVAT